jgi:murein DD-endopeptidase MepM/ murein hydrolase activator NlpD
MTSLLRVGRTAVVALALMGVELGLAAHAGAQVVPPTQNTSTSGSTSPTPSPTPAPTPCATDITGVICQATGGSTPTPSPTPAPTPSPTKTPSSGGGGTTGSGTSGSAPPPPPATTTTTKPGAAPPAAGPPKPSAQAVAEVAATFRNAPFLGALLDALNHPTSAQRPDLRHFRLVGGAGSAGSGSGGLGPGSGVLGLVAAMPAVHGSMGAAVAIALLGMLLAIGIALLVGYPEARLTLRRLAAAAWQLHPSLHRVLLVTHDVAARARRGMGIAWLHLGLPRFVVRQHSHRGLAGASAAAAMPALLVATILGSAATSQSASLASAAQTPLSTYLRGEVSLADEVTEVATVEGPAPWIHLVTIERGLVAQQDELAAQEAQIARLVINLSGHDPDGEDTVVVAHDSPAQQRNSLASLVIAHAATLAVYQQSLQAEYDLYRAAAQDPAQRAQLTAAVATQQPQVKEAVSYNLSLIQTQLSQEATIAAAEAKLEAIGSLTDTQLAAMRKHQPFIAPEVAPVSQPFGPTDFSLEPPLTYNGTFYPHFHTGIDLAAPLDTPVHAAADGVVLLAAASVDQNGKLVGYGNYVVIAHPDGFVTLYGHLDSIAVKAGQVVHQGDIVGQEGSTGWSTGPHVHFEIRHDGQFLDPAPYLTGQLPS